VDRVKNSVFSLRDLDEAVVKELASPSGLMGCSSPSWLSRKVTARA
jgi:hypothetical protein